MRRSESPRRSVFRRARAAGRMRTRCWRGITRTRATARERSSRRRKNCERGSRARWSSLQKQRCKPATSPRPSPPFHGGEGEKDVGFERCVGVIGGLRREAGGGSRRCQSNDRPHPDPLPRGEGTATGGPIWFAPGGHAVRDQVKELEKLSEGPPTIETVPGMRRWAPPLPVPLPHFMAEREKESFERCLPFCKRSRLV